METKRLLLLSVIALLILGLAACERPASTPPTDEAGTPTEVGDFPIPGVTDDVMGQLESFATQTAQAQLVGTPQSSPVAPITTGEAPATTGEVPAATPGTPPDTIEPTVPAPTQGELSPSSSPLPVPSATPGIPNTYTLHKGEFPYCIARRFDVNPNELLLKSGLGSGGTYSTGTVLTIPKSGGDFPGNRTLKSHPTTITAKSGDTIYSVACEFGDADPYAIAAANGLSQPYKITAGQTLHIP